MGWARLDDGFHDHPKVIGLPLEAVGLYTVTLTWAHRHRGASSGLLGHIPKDLPSRFAGARGEELAGVLESHGLWDLEPHLGGWAIHDFADYLPAVDRPATADAVRKARSEAGKRGAAARWADGKNDGKNSFATDLPLANDDPAMRLPREVGRQTYGPTSTNGQADSKLPSVSHSKPMPPSRPVPSRPTATEVAVSEHGDFDAFWSAYPRREAKQAARKAWDKVTRSVDAELIINGAHRYADDPNRDQAFTKHAATWLNGACWDDDPLPNRTSKITRDQNVLAWGALADSIDNQKAIGQ